MSNHVLLIEDNPSLSMALKRVLRSFCKIEQVPTLTGAFNHVAETSDPYDAVIIDRVLPDGDGLEFLEYIRTASPKTMVCVFSGKSDVGEKIIGLQQGADCYLAKPMSAQEFRWHFNALLQREHKEIGSVYSFGELQLDAQNQVLRCKHEQCQLTKREQQVMCLFLRQPQGRASLEQLENVFHHQPKNRPTAVVHVIVQRLRRKLKPLQFTLTSRYGAGYQLSALPAQV
jgi:DNA-binding response OmpR family regulator